MTVYDAGIRVAKTCDGNAAYFSAIDECVPLSIASTQEFLDIFSLSDICIGGEMATQAQIEGMRYCQVVHGGLNITLSDANADFTALFDITTLHGLIWEDMRC